MTHNLEFTEAELKDLYIALIYVKRGNENPDAVEDFTRLQRKIRLHLSASTIRTLAMMEKIDEY